MTPSDLDVLVRHRRVFAARPELREAYHAFFARLLLEAGDRRPIVEVGAGPGFLKAWCPSLLSTDIVPSPWIDAACDGGLLPFRSGCVGAVVMLDVLHHLPRPVEFLREVARVLRPAGRVVAIEPWITPLSYVLYRWFHHEDCRLGIDLDRPFAGGKRAFDGNAALPFELVRRFRRGRNGLRPVRVEPFLGLPYLATFGFQRERPVPGSWIGAARRIEALLGPLGAVLATRALIVWEKT